MDALPPTGTPLHQISDDALETCERAIAGLEMLVQRHGEFPEFEHFMMLRDAIQRVRDDYGPHSDVHIIPT
jgi:hypothetical protein